MIKIVKDVMDANCITHSGIFHPDEIFATVILEKYLDDVKLIRLNEVPFHQAQFVYDIGLGEFDHHQVGGNGKRENGIPYAACGLIWKHIGKNVLTKLGIEDVDYAFKSIDNDLIEYIDADDNGIFPSIDTPYRYVSLSHIISGFNVDDKDLSDSRFLDAYKIASVIFDNIILETKKKIEAKTLFEEALSKTENNILLFSKAIPWKDLLLKSETEKAKKIDYVIFPSIRGGYNILAVPISIKNHDLRKPFPNDWGGLRDRELAEISGIKTLKFSHINHFICVTETLDDALTVANVSTSIYLDANKEENHEEISDH